MMTLPEVGRSSRMHRRMNVDLPEPDGPTRNTNSPVLMFTDTPSRPRCSPSYFLMTPWNCTMGPWPGRKMSPFRRLAGWGGGASTIASMEWSSGTSTSVNAGFSCSIRAIGGAFHSIGIWIRYGPGFRHGTPCPCQASRRS